MIVRAKTFPALSLLLAALLAWPANIPLMSPEPSRLPPVSSALVCRHPGATTHRPERKSRPIGAEWSSVADDLEEAGGRPDSRYLPPTVARPPLDLPSLIPASPDGRSSGRGEIPASSPRSPLLRC